MYEEELMHYGVLGMKWGVRRGKADKAYERASKKLSKIDKRVNKYQKKAHKQMAKASKSRLAKDWHTDKAKKARDKLSKEAYKGEKWVSNMEKTFKNTSIKMSSKQIDLGRKYTNILDMRTMMMR